MHKRREQTYLISRHSQKRRFHWSSINRTPWLSRRRLKTGPRIVLHSVLGKLLPKDQELSLLRADLASDARLAGLMVTQLEITGGWIALALGPAHAERTAWQTPEQRLLSTPFVR